MADVSKAEKLAAARRKLKEFQNQQKNKENSERNNQLSQPQKNGEHILNGSNPKQDINFFENKPHVEEKFELQKPDSISEQPPPLANYFSFASKNNHFFDTLQKSASEESRESNGNDFFYDKDKSSSSSVPEESNITHITTNNSSSISLNEEDSSIISSKLKMNEEEIQKLKHELNNAVTKIKMQADALDIVTTDREDLERKLQNTAAELNSQREIVLSLQNQFEESQKSRIHLNDLVNELTVFKEQAEAKKTTLQQQVNLLKEQNDELQQSLEQQKEKHSNLQKKFEEVQSSRDMMSLKFQQMGIETEGESPNLALINEEYESLKRKYVESQERLKTLMFEKEHTDENYRQYVENLQGELQCSAAELEKISKENENLIQKLASQTDHISSLEKLLQKPEKQVEHETKILQLEAEIQNLKLQLEEKTKQNDYLMLQLEECIPLQEKIRSLENELENTRTDVSNALELQAAVESNKVAASQAIAQNNKLKEELVRLNACVEELNNDKDLLNIRLEEEKQRNVELAHRLDGYQNINNSDGITPKNDAETNTEKSANSSEQNPYGSANLDAMMQLQEKFKCVLNKMADLTDEKQQLEHLVLQLQCETETIEEYVALYQKQRSLLQQRARETDIKVDKMNREKEQLQAILRTILTDNMNSQAVKRFIEINVPLDIRHELSTTEDSEVNEVYPLVRSDSGHHPSCPCCSGKLITI